MATTPENETPADAISAPETPPQPLPTETVNTPMDAQTLFIDHIQGIMTSEEVTKVFFVEQLIPLGETSIRGRYVLNLVFPTSQLRKLGMAFIQTADERGL